MVGSVVFLAAAALALVSYLAWQRNREADDPFLWLDRRIATMDSSTQSEAQRLCEANADQIRRWSDFEVDCDRCALVKDSEGRTRIYGEATDPDNERRIYWIIFKRTKDGSDWEMAGCGVEH